jgi:hypothetical protein
MELGRHLQVSFSSLLSGTDPGACLCFRDEKQIDFAEQVESVAYVLCGEDAITLEKFYQIFQAKGVSSKLRIH